MGRHARGAHRSRLTAVAGVAAVAVAVLGLGLGLGQQSPTDTTASAVVVSSLACNDGPGGTIVDVVAPTAAPGAGQVRADLDACGYREGQQLRVQFVPDDPGQVVLAGNESATDFLTVDRLPYGLMLAALLALGAAVAIWVDARRARGASPLGLGRTVGHSRHGGSNRANGEPRRTAAHEVTDVDEFIDADGPIDTDGPVDLDGVVDDDARPAGHLALLVAGHPAPPTSDGTLWPPVAPRFGRHALLDEPGIGDPADDPALPDSVGPASERASTTGTRGPLTVIEVIAFAPVDENNPGPALPKLVGMHRVDDLEQSLSTVDLTFPFSSSLAACLHDELFTHRTRSG